MSVSITIANVPVLFITLLEEVHCNIALSFVRKWKRDGPVLFLGHYPLDNVVRTIQKLKDEGFHVLARSNHDVSEDDQPDQPPSPIQESLRSYVREGAQQIRKILKDDARISNPRLHPACADLLKIGEFKDAMCIVAESNAGTLLACAKALGIVYPRENGGEATFTRDAELLESPRSSFADLSVLGKLLARTLLTVQAQILPQAEQEEEKAEVFRWLIDAVQGDETARDFLKAKIRSYRAAVKEAERLSSIATWLYPGVLFVNTIGSAKFDHPTLCERLEATGCEVYVIRQADGPIATQCGVEYFLVLTVVKYQSIATDLLPEGIPPGSTIVVHDEGYQLSASKEAWSSVILPALKARAARAGQV